MGRDENLCIKNLYKNSGDNNHLRERRGPERERERGEGPRPRPPPRLSPLRPPRHPAPPPPRRPPRRLVDDLDLELLDVVLDDLEVLPDDDDEADDEVAEEDPLDVEVDVRRRLDVVGLAPTPPRLGARCDGRDVVSFIGSDGLDSPPPVTFGRVDSSGLLERLSRFGGGPRR